jgi:hypothetical protein
MTQYAKQSAEYVIPGIQSVKIHHLYSTTPTMPHHLYSTTSIMPHLTFYNYKMSNFTEHLQVDKDYSPFSSFTCTVKVIQAYH